MKAFVFALTCLLLVTGSLHADPRQWDTTGVVIRQGDDLQWEQVTARNDQGYVLVVWSSYARGDGDIYAQLISPEGTPEWAAGGVQVCGGPATQAHPAAVAVDDGWIIAWIDYRNVTYCSWPDGSCGDVRVQKISSSGQRQWSADGFTGVEVDGDVTYVKSVCPCIVSDHAGGATVVWWGTGNAGGVYAMRVLSDGTPNWELPVRIVPADGYSTKESFADDGNGNVLAVWDDDVDSHDVIMGTKITLDSEPEWGDSGVVISTLLHSRGSKICPDGEGGGYVSWSNEIASDGCIYMQRVNGAGHRMWPDSNCVHDPSSIYSESALLAPSINRDVADGCVMTILDYLSGSQTAVLAKKITPEGVVLWTPGGVQLCSSAISGHSLANPTITSDGRGGAVVAWESRPAGQSLIPYSGIRATRVLSDGTPGWSSSCGVLVSADTIHHDDPSVEVMDSTRIFVGWSDYEQGYANMKGQVLETATGSQVLPAAGLTLATGLNGEVLVQRTVSLSTGNWVTLWEDKRDWSASTDRLERVYFQIFDSLGHAAGAANGDSLTQEESDPNITQSLMSSCPDVEGGFFAMLLDYRAGGSGLRATHINAAGRPVGGPSGQLVWPINGSNLNYGDVFCAADGHSGLFVAWGMNDTVRLSRLDRELNPLWPAPVVVSADARNKRPMGIVAESDGACMVGWQVNMSYDSSTHFATRVGSSGQWEWTIPLSRVILGNPSNAGPQIISDRGAGAYACWLQGSDTIGFCDIYAQHLTSDSVHPWGEFGMIAARRLPANYQVSPSPQPAVDAHRNLMLVWRQQNPNASYDIKAVKLSPWASESGTSRC